MRVFFIFIRANLLKLNLIVLFLRSGVVLKLDQQQKTNKLLKFKDCDSILIILRLTPGIIYFSLYLLIWINKQIQTE